MGNCAPLFMAWSTEKFTGSGALAETFSPGKPFMLEQIRLTDKPSSSKVESFTCVLDSGGGSNYDADFINTPMQDTKSVVCSYGKENKFEADDKLVFAWANSDSKTWGLEVRYMVLC